MGNIDRRRFVGALGEDLAGRHLQARGFELLDTNFRTRHGELDLVAADDRCLVFCEVKARVVAGRAVWQVSRTRRPIRSGRSPQSVLSSGVRCG